MKCLTQTEISSWIRSVGQIADHTQGESEATFHFVFNAPINYNYQAVESFVECFLSQVVITGELLIVTVDAEPSLPCQDFIHNALRAAVNEKRPVSDAPGYSIGYIEREKAIALFSLMSCFGWKCYLYADHDQTAIFNWEGKIFHIWTNSETKKNDVCQMIRNFELQEIRD